MLLVAPPWRAVHHHWICNSITIGTLCTSRNRAMLLLLLLLLLLFGIVAVPPIC